MRNQRSRRMYLRQRFSPSNRDRPTTLTSRHRDSSFPLERHLGIRRINVIKRIDVVLREKRKASRELARTHVGKRSYRRQTRLSLRSLVVQNVKGETRRRIGRIGVKFSLDCTQDARRYKRRGRACVSAAFGTVYHSGDREQPGNYSETRLTLLATGVRGFFYFTTHTVKRYSRSSSLRAAAASCRGTTRRRLAAAAASREPDWKEIARGSLSQKAIRHYGVSRGAASFAPCDFPRNAESRSGRCERMRSPSRAYHKF